jgi:hypothetical protein
MSYLKVTKVASSVLVTVQEGKEGKPIISSSDDIIMRKLTENPSFYSTVSIATCTLTVEYM